MALTHQNGQESSEAVKKMYDILKRIDDPGSLDFGEPVDGGSDEDEDELDSDDDELGTYS